ncbi:MAG: rhodanese-like domain-containing protein [Gaiellales bacterium]
MDLEPDDAPDLLPAEVQELQRTGALLVDVRERDEWEAGRIPGAVHLPLSELAQRWRELPDADATVFVCRSGARSRQAADAFAAAGRAGCANLHGGSQAWVQAGLPFDGHVA